MNRYDDFDDRLPIEFFVSFKLLQISKISSGCKNETSVHKMSNGKSIVLFLLQFDM